MIERIVIQTKSGEYLTPWGWTSDETMAKVFDSIKTAKGCLTRRITTENRRYSLAVRIIDDWKKNPGDIEDEWAKRRYEGAHSSIEAAGKNLLKCLEAEICVCEFVVKERHGREVWTEKAKQRLFKNIDPTDIVRRLAE